MDLDVLHIPFISVSKKKSKGPPIKKAKRELISNEFQDFDVLADITEEIVGSPSLAGSTKKKKLVPKPRQIIPGLYLGNALVAKDYDTLEEYNIKCVLNVTRHLAHYHASKGIQYHRIPIEDSMDEPIHKYFQEGVKVLENWLQTGSGNILVHCKEAKSRSPSMVIAFLMTTRYRIPKSEELPLNLSNAIDLCGGKENLRINDGFMFHLVQLEKKKFGSCSMDTFQKSKRSAKLASPYGRPIGEEKLKRGEQGQEEESKMPATPLKIRKTTPRKRFADELE